MMAEDQRWRRRRTTTTTTTTTDDGHRHQHGATSGSSSNRFRSAASLVSNLAGMASAFLDKISDQIFSPSPRERRGRLRIFIRNGSFYQVLPLVANNMLVEVAINGEARDRTRAVFHSNSPYWEETFTYRGVFGVDLVKLVAKNRNYVGGKREVGSWSTHVHDIFEANSNDRLQRVYLMPDGVLFVKITFIPED